MHHEPALEVAAGAVSEVEAGVVAGLIVRVILGVALKVDDQTPLPDLNLGGGWPLENQRWSQTPRKVQSTVCQNLPFQMWRPGPTWWLELRAIPGVRDLQKLAHKIWASFSIPEVRMMAILGQKYTVPPTPKCLDRDTFLLDELSYQDVQQQPVLLMVAYARGLQYWAEKRNLPESPDFCPLVGSVAELREAVREHVTFTNWDVLWGLGAVHLGATNQWPQISLFSQVLLPPGNEPSGLDTSFTDATTQTAPLVVANGIERENWYLLVITTSVEQLSLGPNGDNPEKSPTDSPRGNTFQNPQMAAVLSGSTRAVSYGGATMKELKEWGGKQTWCSK